MFVVLVAEETLGLIRGSFNILCNLPNNFLSTESITFKIDV